MTTSTPELKETVNDLVVKESTRISANQSAVMMCPPTFGKSVMSS